MDFKRETWKIQHEAKRGKDLEVTRWNVLDEAEGEKLEKGRHVHLAHVRLVVTEK